MLFLLFVILLGFEEETGQDGMVTGKDADTEGLQAVPFVEVTPRASEAHPVATIPQPLCYT